MEIDTVNKIIKKRKQLEEKIKIKSIESYRHRQAGRV